MKKIINGKKYDIHILNMNMSITHLLQQAMEKSAEMQYIFTLRRILKVKLNQDMMPFPLTK